MTDFPPQFLPRGVLPDDVPAAPSGTIFVSGAEGGYAVPARRYTLLFGRDREDVHVPIGASDPSVSRRHGVFTCTGAGGDWWLRNIGRLPIELPGGVLMLTGHERRVGQGYTPLVINSSDRRSHLVEVLVVGDVEPAGGCVTTAPTADPKSVYQLSAPERLVLTALATRYLDGADQYPQPLTWQQTAELANLAPHATKRWTARSVENAIGEVRRRLRTDHGVGGLTRDELGSNVGATLNHNLIRELLRTTTLHTQDLALLGEPEPGRPL